jgi:hypothetical protein
LGRECTKVFIKTHDFFEANVKYCAIPFVKNLTIETAILKTFDFTAGMSWVNLQYLKPISMIRRGLQTIISVFVLSGFSSRAMAQYSDNPLKDERWLSLGAGANTAANLSWQVMGAWSTRGDYFINQIRFGYTQELIEAPDDPFTFRKDRLVEVGYLLGDGWGGKNWYATGSIGLGLNLRLYADSGDYRDRYVAAVSPGLPAQIDFGIMLNKQWGVGFTVLGNFSIRAQYYGALFGIHYRLRED